MTDTDKLQGKMREKKLTLNALASKVGLSPTGLFNKIHNDREFTVSEMLAVSDCLALSSTEREQIFFASV